MTAPAQDEQQQTTPVPRVRHRLCAVQAMAAHYGQPRVTLCGKVKTGTQRVSGGLPPCPMCATVEAEHRAACPACAAQGWT